MRTLKITLAYEGTGYVGWQRQATGISIQSLLETAFAPLEPSPVTIVAAGRTDAGVHALGQVVSVASSSRLSCADLRRALNATLPDSVRVLEIDEAAPRFHARFDARAKTYRYRVLNAPVGSPFETRYAWHVTHALDAQAMRNALDRCRGEHDFAAFQAAGSHVQGTVRRLLDVILIERSVIGSTPGRLLLIELRGTGFLRHMVRNLVGTMVEIGRGRWTPADMERILTSRDRGLAGPTAPPHGLFLVEVEY
jgi:tRNA pseudouridine38-40 synthase